VTFCIPCTTLLGRRGGRRELAPQCSTAAQGVRFVPVGAASVMPDAHEAARQHRQQEAVDTFVGVERQGLPPIPRPTVTVGKADSSIPPIEDPVVGTGDAYSGRASPRRGRPGQGGLGVDAPLFGIELRA
jgi:hypothetical protein